MAEGGLAGALELVAITAEGAPERPLGELPEMALEVMAATAGMYAAGTYAPPWIGYLAIEDGVCVGTCAFKEPPVDNRAELAFFTFPEHEGRGVATRMTGLLVEIALRAAPGVTIAAQTLPEENAATTVLRRNGFRFIAEVEHPEDGPVWEWQRV
jgi:RimJ/RimL family protein N-acetyltransferase